MESGDFKEDGEYNLGFHHQPTPSPTIAIEVSNMAGNREMVGDNCVSVKCSSVCKRKSLANIESLPDDLLFKILLHLPDQDIYDLARLVCRKWKNMIHARDFIEAHFQHSTSGLLLQCLGSYPILIFMREGCIEISKFNYKVIRELVWASWNGLILGCAINRSRYHITNPTTKKRFFLPPYPDYICGPSLSGIAYAAPSMEYKVVCSFIGRKQNVLVLDCAILTVGADDYWRTLRTGHLSLTTKRLFCCPPLTTEGFIHWAGGTEVLTLNVETETIMETHVPFPQVDGEKKHKYYFMSSGRCLSLLVDCENFMWEVWEMKPESGEWKRLPNFNLEAHKCKLEELEGADDRPLKPIGWLKYPEVLLFGMNSYKPQACCIVYKLRTQELDPVELPGFTPNFRVALHRNTLLWLG